MPTTPSRSQTGAISRDQVLRAVKQIIAEQMGIKPEEIEERHALEPDLGCDSLDKVEITMEVEDHFGIDVPDEVADEVRTVGDIVRGVVELLSQAGGGGP